MGLIRSLLTFGVERAAENAGAECRAHGEAMLAMELLEHRFAELTAAGDAAAPVQAA